jgi:importin subunit alpha-1
MPSFEKVQQMLPALSTLLDSVDKMVLSDTSWALSYVTNDTASKIQVVVDAGCIPKLVRLLTLEDIMPALRTVDNFVTGDDRQTDACMLGLSLRWSPFWNTTNTISSRKQHGRLAT